MRIHPPFARTHLPVPLFGILLLMLGCSAAGNRQAETRPVVTEQFSKYWHQGKAEITSYDLEQARYGELRNGEAVTIFVTEDFLVDEQVKLESPPAGRDVVPVLKLNLTKKFITGIYPYSMMTSVFAPADQSAPPHPLKVTTSSQEWCGHTFTQINRRGGEFVVRELSYFEDEGERETKIPVTYLEDELWTRIRLAPATLPVGEIRMVPGTMTARLRHTRPEAEEAAARVVADSRPPWTAECGDCRLSAYEITYPAAERSLSIWFRSAFPHQIEGWRETYRDGAGERSPVLTTTARARKRIMSDYWKRNSVADSTLRRELDEG